ncbi:MAG: 2-isopropylmalate synthase [Pseudobacteriovorax sp.]|nr:2-isopropylmalate synthase [Pseudobacteriovorax sp.]
MATNQVLIFDTTLRDGEQSPGASMGVKEKLEVAALLEQLNVDVIEAGFPASSPGDFKAVETIASSIKGPTIAGLSRCKKDDILRTADALKDAKSSRIHLFLATSDIHRKYKLCMSKDEVLQSMYDAITLAKQYFDDIEFSAEDASRTSLEFLKEVSETAIDAGATTLNIPDTVGFAVPEHYAAMIRYLKEQVSRIDEIVLSVHCHNDLGLAVANSLAAVGQGARQVECTINGIGERAGNCALEEVVMALHTRKDHFGLETNIDTTKLYSASQLVSAVTGLDVQRNKAIVGQNAFAHEAGIHQHGVLMNPETYEIMKPEDVGLAQNQLVLGKHSGKHAFRRWLSQHGFLTTDDTVRFLFDHFKTFVDQNHKFAEADLEIYLREKNFLRHSLSSTLSTPLSL